jgi:hypothetical protein
VNWEIAIWLYLIAAFGLFVFVLCDIARAIIKRKGKKR